MKISILTLGCKVNSYESFGIAKQLEQKGHEVVTELEKADLYILNTCAVTSEAERKSKQTFSKIKKLNSEAKIIVCGCSSQNSGKAYFEKDKNALVIGTKGKNNLVNMLEEKGLLVEKTGETYEDFDGISEVLTRAYIKIQDGCNNFCSYCLIPYVRGRSRSRSIESVLKEINNLDNSVKEYVLTGINLSAYGKDFGSSLTDLMYKLKDDTRRIRLGSLEVNVITDEFLTALKGLKNFCPHFHLSLQSGSNEVLKKMNRHYTTQEFLEKVELIRKYFPLSAITTDIITGFPTESDDNQEETKEFLKEVEFFDMHVFPYSIRTGTVASKMEQVNGEVKKKREKELIEIKKQGIEKYINKFLGQEVEVLFEQRQGEYFTGHTKNYIKVYFKTDENLSGCLKNVRLSKLYKDGSIGE